MNATLNGPRRQGGNAPRLSRALLAASLGAVGTACANPVIVNGSFTDVPGWDKAAPGWTMVDATPDVVDVNGPFNATGHQWVASPDGGTWARGNGLNNAASESFSQAISGFAPGVTYTFDFAQTNTGAYDQHFGYLANPGQWQFFIDGSLIGASAFINPPATKDDPNVWYADSVSFTATSTTHTLLIRAENTNVHDMTAFGMGIDGLGVRVVPAAPCGAILGIAGFGAARRRR